MEGSNEDMLECLANIDIAIGDAAGSIVSNMQSIVNLTSEISDHLRAINASLKYVTPRSDSYNNTSIKEIMELREVLMLSLKNTVSDAVELRNGILIGGIGKETALAMIAISSALQQVNKALDMQ